MIIHNQQVVPPNPHKKILMEQLKIIKETLLKKEEKKKNDRANKDGRSIS